MSQTFAFGTFYASATLSSTGTDDGLLISGPDGEPVGITAGRFVITSDDIATDETLDADLQFSPTSDLGGVSDQQISFVQLTSSVSKSVKYLNGTSQQALGPYVRVQWTIGGAAPSLSFTIYFGAVILPHYGHLTVA